MATMVDYGADVFDIFDKGRPNDSIRDVLTERAEWARRSFSDTTRGFIDRAKDLHRSISSSKAGRILRKVQGKMDGAWRGNQITPCETLEQIQTASLTMQRWIMAEPTLRRRFLNQEASGFENTYQNRQGNFLGERQLDWRRVHDGVIRWGEESYVLKRYYDLLDEGDNELKTQEKLDILTTFARVKALVEAGEQDPSSTCGAML